MYSLAMSNGSRVAAENRQGLARMASADITASAPVSFMHLSMSSKVIMLPLDITGMDTASLQPLEEEEEQGKIKKEEEEEEVLLDATNKRPICKTCTVSF